MYAKWRSHLHTVLSGAISPIVSLVYSALVISFMKMLNSVGEMTEP